MKKNVRKAAGRSHPGNRTAASVAKTDGSSVRMVSGWKLWCFRAALMIGAPLLTLLALEAGLRLSGYGYPVSLFLSSGADYIDNEKFLWRFYSPETNLRPIPTRVAKKKGPGEVRILVMGESAAAGTPEPAYGFARILQLMLREQYPEKRIEVVNAAMRGINSHIITSAARDSLRLEPDLFLIYAGNNELVGLYAPGPETSVLAESLPLLRFVSWVKEHRIGQLIAGAAGLNQGSKETQDLEFFQEHRISFADPRRDRVYSHFEKNLRDLCATGLEGGARVVLATVAVNLKDCPPFGSLHRADLTEETKRNWEAIYERGKKAERAGEWTKALEYFEQAAEMDSQFADLHYRVARCYEALGKFDMSAKYYRQARNWDALPFRADDRINGVIRNLGEELKGRGLVLADLEAAFAESSKPLGVAGEELFHEHVHFRFAGDYLLARTLLPVVAEQLREKLGEPAKTELPDRTDCAAKLGYTILNEVQIEQSILKLTSHPPFTGQLEHASRQRQAEERFKIWAQKTGLAEAEEELQAYREAIAQNPEDWQLHQQFAKALMLLKRPEEAIASFQRAADLMPHSSSLKMDLARALARTGRRAEATQVLEQIVKQDPQNVPARTALSSL